MEKNNKLGLDNEFAVSDEDITPVGPGGVREDDGEKTDSNSLINQDIKAYELTSDDREFINLLLTKDLESVDKRRVSRILVKLGYEPIVNEEDYVFDEEKFYEELEKKQNGELDDEDGEADKKKKKKKLKISPLAATILTFVITASACLIPSYMKYTEQTELHQVEVDKLNAKIEEAKNDSTVLVADKDEYISYLELLMEKSNMYYGGELKLEFIRDTNTGKLLVKDINAKNLDDYIIDKYTRSWGDKREFDYIELEDKLVYLGPEK